MSQLEFDSNCVELVSALYSAESVLTLYSLFLPQKGLGSHSQSPSIFCQPHLAVQGASTFLTRKGFANLKSDSKNQPYPTKGFLAKLTSAHQESLGPRKSSRLDRLLLGPTNYTVQPPKWTQSSSLIKRPSLGTPSLTTTSPLEEACSARRIIRRNYNRIHCTPSSRSCFHPYDGAWCYQRCLSRSRRCKSIIERPKVFKGDRLACHRTLVDLIPNVLAINGEPSSSFHGDRCGRQNHRIHTLCLYFVSNNISSSNSNLLSKTKSSLTLLRPSETESVPLGCVCLRLAETVSDPSLSRLHQTSLCRESSSDPLYDLDPEIELTLHRLRKARNIVYSDNSSPVTNTYDSVEYSNTNNFVEPEQMENNDQTLKELATPDVVYQPWKRSSQALKRIPCCLFHNEAARDTGELHQNEGSYKRLAVFVVGSLQHLGRHETSFRHLEPQPLGRKSVGYDNILEKLCMNTRKDSTSYVPHVHIIRSVSNCLFNISMKV
ncbi:hypothetical protein CR513_41566, partial [Mucuna pruriens]